MILPSAALLLACVQPPGSPDSEPTVASAPASRPAVEVLVVETVGIDSDEFAQELQLRLPNRKIIGVNAPRPPSGFAYIHVARVPPDTLKLSLVEPDGRAYDQRLAHEPDQEVRVASSAVATLLSSVESGAALPDRRDARIPASETPATDEPTKPEEAPPTDQPRAQPAPAPAVVELGVTAAGVVGLGLAPLTDAGSFGGGGGLLQVSARHRSGGLGQLELRAAQRNADPLSATRLRLTLGGGYTWRWDHLEVPLLAGVSIEPWWVRQDGDSATLQYQGDLTTRRPLLGAVATTAPGYFWRSRGTPTVALRVGPRVSVVGSFVPHEGARTIRIDVIDGTGGRSSLLRLGGLEVELGAGLTVWFSGPQSSQ